MASSLLTACLCVVLANSRYLVFVAEPLSALNNIRAQVLRNAGDSEVCQKVATCAYSTEQIMQMSRKTNASKTKKASNCPPDAAPLRYAGGQSF